MKAIYFFNTLLLLCSLLATGIHDLQAQITTVEDFESGTFSEMNWQFSGTPNSWFVEQTMGAIDSITFAATAKAIAFNDEVTLSITKTFEAPSTITFDLKQTEANVLIFGYGDNLMYWPGWDAGWQSMSIDVPAGTHEIKFISYNMGSFGEPFSMNDSLFIDNITFPNQAHSHPAYVQLVHNAADPQLSSVDVYLDDEVIIEDFNFRSATAFVELPGGTAFNLAVRAANSSPASPALWSGNYTLEQGTSYQIIAEGLLDEAGFEPFIPFDLAVYINARQSAMMTGNTDILIHHGSTDAPTVTVTAEDAVLATNLAYGNFAGYFEVPSQNIVLGVLDATTSGLIGSFYASLEFFQNQSITVLASGFANPSVNNNGAAFGLYAVNVAGGDFVNLPLLTENLLTTNEDFETADFSKLNWHFDGTPGAWHIVTDSETATLAATASHQDFNEYQTMYFYGFFEEDSKMLIDVKQTSENSIVIISTNNDGTYFVSDPPGSWQTVEVGVQAGFQQISFTSYIIGAFGETFVTQNDSVLIDNIRFEIVPEAVQLSTDAIDFGMSPVHQAKVATLYITNLTDALMMFNSFQTTTNMFTAYPETWAIESGDSLSVAITFTPGTLGPHNDVLSIGYFGYLGSGTVELPLSGEGIVMPPSNLTAVIEENAVTLSWMPPGSSPNTLRFGNGQAFTSMGTSEGVYEFAMRFTPADLMPYAGKQLEKVGFYIHSANADFAIKVYSGPDADSLLVDLPVSSLQANAWNDIILPSPILLDDVDYLWIGYEINQASFDFIAGVDGGPGVVGSGDLLRINGSMWTTLHEYAFYYNWNIRGVLTAVQGSAIEPNMELSRNNIELLGYNVYRDSTLLNSSLVEGLNFTDEITSGFTYNYTVTAVYDIGESAAATVTVTVPNAMIMPQGWEFNPTPMAHNIHIPIDVTQIGMNLTVGDMIGAFYLDNGMEKAAGAGMWDGEHLIVTIYGNDPSTPFKDGFNENETITWKLYMQSNGNIAELTADYNSQMPHHDGTFKMLGLSMIEGIELGVVGLDDSEKATISLFPNPSSGAFRINGVMEGDIVRIYETSGRIVSEQFVSQREQDFTLSAKGFYLIELQRGKTVIREKLIIN